MSVEEYLDFELNSERPHEFFGGELFEVEAATFAHQSIGSSLIGALQPALRQKGCVVHFSGTRVAHSPRGPFVYPDLVAFCGKPMFFDPGTLSNPVLIVEILSPSTKNYDLSQKFELYRKIPSVLEYLAVHQDQPLILQHSRQSDGAWLLREWRGLESILRLEPLAVELPLASIYQDIAFSE